MPKRWREEDEDEEEEEFDSKWRRAASHFFELEADVDSDEDGDSEDSDAEDDFIDDARVDEKDNFALRQRHVIHPQIGEDEDEEDIEEFERRIEERYGRKSRYEEEEDTIEVFQQALLPTVTDSKLWMVKCAIGHEKEVEACLMQKQLDKAFKLQIKSVIALDHLQTLYTSKQIKNLMLERRIVNGDDIRRRITVKLIPRIDFRALVNQFDGIKIPKEEKFCPPARFWSATKATALGIPVTRKKDSVTGDYFDTVNGMKFLKFKDGLLYKSVSIRSIGYKGRVLRVDDDVVYLKPESEGLPQSVAIHSKDLTCVTVLLDKSINTFDVLVDHVEENSELAYSRVPPRSVSIPNVRPLPPPKKGNAYGDVRSASIANFRRPPSPQKKGYDFGRARRDPLLNARIKIRQGLHNGMVGRVVEVRGHRVRVELEAQMNHAYVDRSQIYEIGEADNSIFPEEHYGLGSETPVYCPRTPLRPWMTPARDAPATPIHEGMRTPIRSRAWNPCS
ncbi:putative transcription elongation factor SPT5 -like protein 1 [Capsicum baccatum]|uniref:Transcription elongation factor SPT5-like protein 1 n=1 Tax=Capsicum baccatum TaxID=33114 RepID=A0A2G2X0N7_CAPBA|nr:putative transcription elongation factor SPT5 -like protein 1 [Capsicum baccatum]